MLEHCFLLLEFKLEFEFGCSNFYLFLSLLFLCCPIEYSLGMPPALSASSPPFQPNSSDWLAWPASPPPHSNRCQVGSVGHSRPPVGPRVRPGLSDPAASRALARGPALLGRPWPPLRASTRVYTTVVYLTHTNS
jgi:hypothetical protein